MAWPEVDGICRVTLTPTFEHTTIHSNIVRNKKPCNTTNHTQPWRLKKLNISNFILQNICYFVIIDIFDVDLLIIIRLFWLIKVIPVLRCALTPPHQWIATSTGAQSLSIGQQNECSDVRCVVFVLFPVTPNMSHSQMLGKFEYGLPAKFWRLVGCTEMLSW